MKKLLLLAIAALFVSSCATVEIVVPKGSVPLGQRTVNFKADHDMIQVGGYEGTFKSLYFVVEKNDIEIFNIVVTYGNGEKQRLETRLRFSEGSRSRAITFEGGKRRIRAIAFTYRTIGTWQDGKARVAVYGVR